MPFVSANKSAAVPIISAAAASSGPSKTTSESVWSGVASTDTVTVTCSVCMNKKKKYTSRCISCEAMLCGVEAAPVSKDGAQAADPAKSSFAFGAQSTGVGVIEGTVCIPLTNFSIGRSEKREEPAGAKARLDLSENPNKISNNISDNYSDDSK